MNEHAGPKHTNRLAQATSPYLLQHAHNPVDWYPWGADALRKAQAEDKPILLSIGYSACHWCHVMERESFEDEHIAGLMNDSFVSIKVDREERPDLDDIYMQATLAMNQGQGGWPMTVFLTPEQEPFFAGTYFPPEDRYGRPGFPTVLTRIAELWRTERSHLREQAAELSAHLRASARSAPGAALGEEELRAAVRQLADDFDERHGGFGRAPKFPPSAALSLLMRAHRRFGDAQALEMARTTLAEMARGGLYDQVGGGFHRYSVDERWLVPHFEKMLYDNAQLARVYLEGFQATGDPFFRRVATEVLDYVLREMTDAQGGFYSATDADSEGEEGRFFVWTPAELAEVLGEDDARLFGAYYDVSARGNWEGHNIPNTSRTGARVAKSLGIGEDELERRVATLRPRVYEARLRRVPPARDDKVLTAWNGLMIGALAEGHRVLREPRYRAAAERAASFVLATLARPDGRLLRTWRAGTAHLDAYLEDYAFLADALVDLYEAGADERFLREAERLTGLLHEDFAAEDGGFYSTSRGHEPLIVRHREGHDGAIPSANAVAARVQARLSYHLDRPGLREEAVRAIRAYGRAAAHSPRAFTTTLAVVDLLLEGPTELAFVGAPGAEDHEALQREAGRRYLPNRIVAHHDPAAASPSALPLLAGKGLVEGRAALYVCRDFACQRPLTDPAEVAAALDAAQAGAGKAARELGRALPGSASPEGTKAYAGRHGPAGYGPLGSTGLVCSRVGFGGYRVDDETPEHREALLQALRGGCNLIDTSTNYTDGGSERLLGDSLADLVRTETLAREEVIVVSKVGYVQGANLRLAREREASGEPFPEMVKYAEGVWHCIHPDFLRDQLARSLGRLGLEALDVCLLHNPEYFLSDAHERSFGTLEKRREEFYRRLQESFAHLESEVAQGRIRWYGVSSNTCTRPSEDPEATSLARMLEAARAAGGDGHHFRVLQLPLNLFEDAAALERRDGETVLQHALRHDVGVLANRPLNALVGEGMMRLASVEPAPGAVDLDQQLARLRDLEAEYRRDIAARLRAGEGSLEPDQFFRWGSELAGATAHVRSLEHWEQIQAQRIMPMLLPALRALDEALSGPAASTWHDWRGRYLPALHAALEEIRRRAALRSREAAAAVERALDPHLPEERRGQSLSRKALWVVASTPGVSSALIGMRRPEYVEDALGVLPWPPLEGTETVYAALRTAELPARTPS